MCYGAASRYLGMLAATLGEFEKAEAHFEHRGSSMARPHESAVRAASQAPRREGRQQRAETLANEAWKIAAELDMVLLRQRLQTRIQ